LIRQPPTLRNELRLLRTFVRRSRETIRPLPTPYRQPTLFLHNGKARRMNCPVAHLLSLCRARKLPLPRAATSARSHVAGDPLSKSDNRAPSRRHNVPRDSPRQSSRSDIGASLEAFRLRSRPLENVPHPSRNQPFRLA